MQKKVVNDCVLKLNKTNLHIKNIIKLINLIN